VKVDSYFTREIVRPWKVLALGYGISVLAYGMAVEGGAPDWTWPTILAMSAATHLLAPWSVDVFWSRRWKLIPLALLAGWFAVDGAWMLSIDGSAAAWSMREGQWAASLCLFLTYGLLLRPKASLREVLTFKKKSQRAVAPAR
jgi:hypothetical protein